MKKFTYKLLSIITAVKMIVLFTPLYCQQSFSFDDLFEKVKEIHLQTENLEIGYLKEIAIDFYENILFLDPKGCQIIVFNQEGEFKKRVGGKGQGPGEFSFPTAMSVDNDGNIFISDHRSRRINIFDKEGKFISSFITSASHWQPVLIRNDSKKNIFFGGYQLDYEKKAPGKWINKYNSSGKYKNSFYRAHTNQDWLRNVGFFDFDIDDKNEIYAVQMNKYVISVFNSEGQLLKTLGAKPSYFKELNSDVIFDFKKFKNPSSAKNELLKLSKSWTKILQVKVICDNYLLLVIETNNLIKGLNEKYILDVWDKEGNFIVGRIPTDYKLLHIDKEGYVYFLIYSDEGEATEKDAQYKIGKYKFIFAHGK